jgi:hypothetical protein
MTTDYYSDPLQEQIVQRLRQDAQLGACDILHEERRDILNEIKRGLGKLGFSIIVNSVIESCSSINTRTPLFDQVSFTVSCLENVLINRQAGGLQIPCKTAAKLVVAALWHFRPDGFAAAVYTDSPAIQFVSDRTVLIYKCNFKLGK